MQESSTKRSTILQFRQEVERQLREQIRQAVEVALDEELAGALGSGAMNAPTRGGAIVMGRWSVD